MFHRQSHYLLANPAPTPRRHPPRLALGAVLALLGASAAAQVTSMRTFGDYAVDGASATTLVDNWTPANGAVTLFSYDNRTEPYSHSSVADARVYLGGGPNTVDDLSQAPAAAPSGFTLLLSSLGLVCTLAALRRRRPRCYPA
ncbi:hypothetical protein ACFOLJ_25385 [Rugamonas sp. CCM 8940]|uniref:hypothetical protein n=1 Tax=Rugamonas sp. CCM 8940 TaxID=2765359 RepID=UPI0018F55BE2|nr:hypothetical protein [Rugamonas sp. CCM 8940]MBJ7310896.1 hypothetical protein [Rugamonas sp. CCM 8940]